MLDLLKETPEKKSDLQKDNMLAFMQNKSKEEKEWFKELFLNNKKQKTNNLKNGETVMGYDYTIIREEFAIKYFPKISAAHKKEEKKAKAKAKKQEDFESKLMNL
ncbi:MAG: hypothetical protein MJ237_09105 [bacterium]|nr:hypothetical protein [bacterium]